jgi:Xaa-Pro aminopeptidase
MGLGENKVPFIGHGIGLFVDDFPPLTGKLKEPLQENMTLALEPKVGLPGLGMVGVEDTFVVTPEGGRSLSGEERDMISIESGSC